MEDGKPWWQSNSIWGGIVAGLAGLAGLFGYQLDRALQVDIASWIVGLASLIGGVWAIFGRVKASKKIG